MLEVSPKDVNEYEQKTIIDFPITHFSSITTLHIPSSSHLLISPLLLLCQSDSRAISTARKASLRIIQYQRASKHQYSVTLDELLEKPVSQMTGEESLFLARLGSQPSNTTTEAPPPKDKDAMWMDYLDLVPVGKVFKTNELDSSRMLLSNFFVTGSDAAPQNEILILAVSVIGELITLVKVILKASLRIVIPVKTTSIGMPSH